MEDNGGKNIKLDQPEFIAMGPLSEASGFNMEAHTVRVSKVCSSGSLKNMSKDTILKRSWKCLLFFAFIRA